MPLLFCKRSAESRDKHKKRCYKTSCYANAKVTFPYLIPIYNDNQYCSLFEQLKSWLAKDFHLYYSEFSFSIRRVVYGFVQVFFFVIIIFSIQQNHIV